MGKLLYSTDNFNVIERDGKVGIEILFTNVVIMPFIRDEQGLPLAIGVIKEPNPFREGGNSISLITGTTEDEDPDFYSTAVRELEEESGYKVDDASRWYYLGNVYSSKLVDHEQPCFAVDVTGITRGQATGDGSEYEAKQEFVMIPANDVVKVKDVFIPGLFLKLFKYVLGMDLQNPKDKDLFSPQGLNDSI
jgi:8-oxo-dGTP pyrophosphatase MutT (NUDIX family)